MNRAIHDAFSPAAEAVLESFVAVELSEPLFVSTGVLLPVAVAAGAAVLELAASLDVLASVVGVAVASEAFVSIASGVDDVAVLSVLVEAGVAVDVAGVVVLPVVGVDSAGVVVVLVVGVVVAGVVLVADVSLVDVAAALAVAGSTFVTRESGIASSPTCAYSTLSFKMIDSAVPDSYVDVVAPVFASVFSFSHVIFLPINSEAPPSDVSIEPCILSIFSLILINCSTEEN